MSSKLNIWRHSASLILAAKSNFSRPNPSNYKLLMLKRSGKSGFMPSNYVFPGGVISKSDSNLAWLELFENFGFGKQTMTNLQAIENIPSVLQNDEETLLPKYLSFRICAIRETFEECGILICKSLKINSTVSPWASFRGGQELHGWQHKVHDDPEQFLNLCSHFEIVPDVWALHNWSNWLTPATFHIKKFDTIFFLATLDQMPTAHKDEREIQDLMWTTPEDCIQANQQEKIELPVPQFYEISRLRNFTDIKALNSFANERAKYGFDSYWPHCLTTDEGKWWIFPGDDLYSVTRDKDVTKVPYLASLPESKTKHRILRNTEYSTVIQIDNYVPKCRQVNPVIKAA